MARRPLPLGTWGRISRTQLAPNLWVAKVRVRDHDGVTRLVERRTPADAKRDDTGAGAENALLLALADRVAPSKDALKASSKVSLLWEVRRIELGEEGLAITTLDRYDYTASAILKALGEVRLSEIDTQKLQMFLRAYSTRHGAAAARTARSVLIGMFNLAVRFKAMTVNPVREVKAISGSKSKASRALTVDELKAILSGVRSSSVILPATRGSKAAGAPISVSTYAERVDLVDVVTILAATGCRISEAIGLRWTDVDLDRKTVSINGKVVRGKGIGLIREDFTKSKAGERVLPLPEFAVSVLRDRLAKAEQNVHNVVFPSSTGTLRDVDNTIKQWSRVRDALGFDWVTSHTFRRTLATIIDAEGMSARIGADQLGHSQVSMTQDKYMGRKRTHTEVAELMDRTVSV